MARDGIRLSVRGQQGLIANMHRKRDGIVDAITQVSQEQGQDAYTLAMQLVPVLTGFMQSSLTLEYSAQGLSWTLYYDERLFAATGQAYYPVFVEYGTRFQSAQPTLEPVWETVLQAWAPEYSRAIRGEL